MANIPTLPTRLPAVGVPVARLRLPTPAAGGAAALARAGGLVAEIGLRNQQAERSNDLAELKLRILQARDEAAQAAEGAKAGTQVETANAVFGRVREGLERLDDDRLREPALLNLEATLTLMQPKLRALESSMLVDRANATTIEARSALMAAGTIGTRAESESASASWRGLWDDRIAAGTADEGPAAAEIARFDGELVQNRAIELASTDPEAALALLKSPRAIENLTAASRASIRRAIDGKRQVALSQNIVTSLADAGRLVDTWYLLDDHIDPVAANTRLTELSNELASLEGMTATSDEIKLGLLQNAMANAAQTGNWPLVQRLEPALIQTLEGRTAFDRLQKSALVQIRAGMRAMVLQAAVDGETTIEDVTAWASDAGRRFVENRNDPLGMSPDAAQDIVNRAAALLENQATEEALGGLYRANRLLPGVGTGATQKIVDREFQFMVSSTLSTRGFSADPAVSDPKDVLLAMGEVLEQTKVTGAFPTVVIEGIQAGMRSVDTVDFAADLARLAQTAAPETYKTQIPAPTRAMMRQYSILKDAGMGTEDAFKAATQSVFEISPGRAAAFEQAQKSGFREQALTSLIEKINEDLKLGIDVDNIVEGKQISTQVSEEAIALHFESLRGAFLRTSNRAGGRERAIEEANEIFFKIHGITGIDSEPRLMKFAPENANVYGRPGWGSTEMREELAQDLIEHHRAGTLILPEGIAAPAEPARRQAGPIPVRGIPVAPVFTRTDEQIQAERIRNWSSLISELVILEPDTLNLTRTRRGPKPEYVVMMRDKDGIPTSVNISRGNLAPQPFLVDFEYEDSRAGRKALAEQKEADRLRDIKQARALKFKMAVDAVRERFGVMTILR